MEQLNCRSVNLKALDHCGLSLVLFFLAILTLLLLLSCSGGGDTNAPATSVPGDKKLTTFSITSVTFPGTEISVGTIPCIIIETTTGTGCSVFCTLPGGADHVFTVTFEVEDGGTVQINGASAMINGTSATSTVKTIDLETDTEIIVIDGNGRQRVYTLDIRDSGLPSVYITIDPALLAANPGFPEDKVAIGPAFITIKGSTSPFADYAKTDNDIGPKQITIQGRGNSTLTLPKKPYRINFSTATSVLGLPEARKWVLLANHADKSLIRNYVALETARTMENLAWTPKTLPVDLYLNGVYQGSYCMGDQVEVGTSRLNITTTTAGKTTGYFIEVNGRVEADTKLGIDYFYTTFPYKFDYKSPKLADLLTDKTFINTFVQTTETYLLTGLAADVALGDISNIDVNSFIDWLIVEELFKNTDSNFFSSVYMYMENDPTGLSETRKLKMGPVWDFDLSAGNQTAYGGSLNSSYHYWFTSKAHWYNDRLLKNADFRAALIARWIWLCDHDYNGLGLKVNVLARIDEAAARIARSQKMNFAKWDINALMEDVDEAYPKEWVEWYTTPAAIQAAKTFEAQVALFKEWMTNRIEAMDGSIRIGEF